MKTKIALILLGLGLSSSCAYAAHGNETPMPISNDVNVTAPDQSGTWSLGLMAVLMQATNSAFDYADSITTPSNASGGVDQTFSRNVVDQGYHWWFAADVTYAFPGNGRDVTLAYEGLHGSNSDNTNTDSDTLPDDWGNVLASTFSSNGYLQAEGKTQTSYDAGDLVFGQKLNMGQRIRLHPFAGVRYAYIDVKDSGQYADGVAFMTGNPIASESGLMENTFNGIGPRLGSDADVNLGAGFSIHGRLGLSALIGSHSIKDQYTIAYDDDLGTVTYANNTSSETAVIPEIDARLGLNYGYQMDNNTNLSFEAGWQVTNYFNVVTDQYQAANLYTKGSGTNYQSQAYESTSNFGVQGPYARVQLDIA